MVPPGASTFFPLMVSLVIDALRNQSLLNYPRSGNFDGFVKSPDAALRFILCHCGVRQSTPHSLGFVRLACELFTKPSQFHVL
jgi:hypothetical protein